jgi:hypothetical protein
MSDDPRIRAQCDALKALLARIAAAGNPRQTDRVRGEAERMVALLSGKVRVALLGREDGGKAQLLEFLLGQTLLPADLAGPRPTLIVSHARTPALVAGWWDGRRSVLKRADVAAALAQRPDYLEFQLPSQSLDVFSFIDMPAGAEREEGRRNFNWLVPRADIVLWCKPAREPWAPAEARLWETAPEALRGASLLIATEAERLSAETFAEAAARIQRDTRGAFHKVIPVSAARAIAAAPGGAVTDPRGWQESGARALLLALLDRARAVRAGQLVLVEALLRAGEEALSAPREVRPNRPVRPKVHVFEDPSPAAPRLRPVATPAPQPEPPAGPAAGSSAATPADEGEDEPGQRVELLERFDGWLDGLMELLDAEPSDEDAFLAAAAGVLDELSFAMSDYGVMQGDTLWVNESVEAAADRVGELRAAAAPGAAAAAAALMLQLSRDLCWTVAS